MKRIRWITLLLAVVLCLSLITSCGSGTTTATSATTSGNSTETTAGETTAAVSEETLNVALGGEPDLLFPNYNGSKVDDAVGSSIFGTLVYWNDVTKKAEPSLATSWKWLDDNFTSIEFTLRDDVYFTNGEKMTAEDVLFSLEYTTLYQRARYALMFDIANSAVIDDTHLKIALKSPYGNLIDILGCDYYGVFSKKAYEDAGSDYTVFSRNPVSCGPFQLTEWKQGESITLTRNENYWDKDNMPYFKTIVYHFIGDASARALALQAGDVQVALNLNNTQIPDLENAGNITVNAYVQNVVQPLTMNQHFPALADENVRKAILLAIDKNALAQAAYQGYSQVAKSSLIGTTSSYYYESEKYTQDVATARQLIEASGWTAADLTFTMYTPSGMDSSETEILQAQLAAIGITINIETVDFPTFLGHIWAGETSLLLGENDTWDVNRMLNQVDSRVEGYFDAYIGEDVDELHALIDAATSASDADRYDAYAAVQQFCSDHYVCTAIANTVFTDAYSSSLTGLEHDSHSWPTIYNMRPAA